MIIIIEVSSGNRAQAAVTESVSHPGKVALDVDWMRAPTPADMQEFNEKALKGLGGGRIGSSEIIPDAAERKARIAEFLTSGKFPPGKR